MPATLELEENLDAEYIPEILPYRYEVIDGQIVEKPPMSDLSNTIANRLLIHMGSYTFQENLGETLMEALVKLPAPVNRNRRPDVCYISYDRWPQEKLVDDRNNGRDVVPDLAVEVISPSDFGEDLQEKLVEYFSVGVRQVWLIFPRARLLYIYDSITSVRGFSEADVVEVGTILPGYRFTLRDIFRKHSPA